MGQAALTCKFYMRGRKEFTRTGWLAHAAAYPKPDPLDSADYAGRVAVITGANSGIGKEVARYLASRGGTVYMVCRSAERAQKEREQIVQSTGNQSVHVLVADCGLTEDVRRVASELRARETGVDCLVCNAGAMDHTRVLTKEGHEVTFATHLLSGTYLMAEELRPLLSQKAGSRVVVVSSGGMYNVKYDHDLAIGAAGKYNGQFAYAYAKRGQVLLCEHWSQVPGEKIKFVSCHPGWTDTPAVEAAYGSSKSWLQPMRSSWEGAEGICWLCVAPSEQLEGGGFYLDRSVQPKHFSSRTHNTLQERQHLAAELAKLVAAPAANGAPKP